MFLTPLAEGDDGWFGSERDRLPFSRTRNGRPLCSIQRIPQALRLSIEDEEHVLVDIAADAEPVDLAVVVGIVSQLPEVVAPPAVQRVVGSQGAGVALAVGMAGRVPTPRYVSGAWNGAARTRVAT